MADGSRWFSTHIWPTFLLVLSGAVISAAIIIVRWGLSERSLPTEAAWLVPRVLLSLGILFLGMVGSSRIPVIRVGARGLSWRPFPFFRRVEFSWDELTVQPIMRFAGARMVRLRSAKKKKALWLFLPLRDMAGFRALVEQYAPGNEEVAKLVGDVADKA